MYEGKSRGNQIKLVRVSMSSSYQESTVHCKVQKEVQGNKTRIVLDNESGVRTLHPLSESIANRSLPCFTLYMQLVFHRFLCCLSTTQQYYKPHCRQFLLMEQSHRTKMQWLRHEKQDSTVKPLLFRSPKRNGKQIN